LRLFYDAFPVWVVVVGLAVEVGMEAVLVVFHSLIVQTVIVLLGVVVLVVVALVVVVLEFG